MTPSLLEDFAISPWVLLAANDQWLLPSPLLVDELLVLRLRSIQLGELVTLKIWCDVKSRKSLLATNDKSTLDDRVILDTIYRSTSKDILTGSLQTSKESTDKVRGHKHLCELIVVLVVKLPQRVLLGVVVLPEPLKSIGGMVVRVLTLPLIKWESSLWQSLKRVLWFWGSWSLIFFLFNFLGLWLWGSLLLFLFWLGFLLWGSVLDGFVDEVELVNNGRIDLLVVDSLVPAGDIWVGCSERLIKNILESTGMIPAAKRSARVMRSPAR
jgi:hypothetical protein